MDGLLLIDKPKGWTSFDVVAKVRGILKHGGTAKPKVGHTGTLDPLATGLLVLTLGTYCKRAGEFSALAKTYEAEVTLGQTSTTDDDEGEKLPQSDKKPAAEEITTVLQSFLGEQSQTPPKFSAIKIDGQRAYKLARKGQEVAMKSRPITIYAISKIAYEYPKVTFSVDVSSGTYIRSLARDIGERLGTGAYLSGLRRTTVGKFDITDAAIMESLTSETIYARLVHVRPS
jgi:tRNA pseudouridine55 synthase